MKQSLKELINGLEEPKDSGLRFMNETNQFIEEAKRGKNWSTWQKNVFEQFFEKNLNCVAKKNSKKLNKYLFLPPLCEYNKTNEAKLNCVARVVNCGVSER